MRRAQRLMRPPAEAASAELTQPITSGGDGGANHNDVLGLCPIRNDDRDRLDPYGRDRDRGRGHL